MNNVRIAGIGVAAFGVSLLVLHFTGDRNDRDGLDAPSRPGALVGEPRNDVARQIAALEQSQRELRDSVARLEERLDSIGTREIGAPQPSTLTAPVTTPAQVAVAQVRDVDVVEPGSDDSVDAADGPQPRQQLLDAGFSPDETDAIIRAVDENTLARLQLRYRAARGGDESRGARAELRQLPRAVDVVREEFGEGAYDRYLYATGQPNRIVVRNVLSSSSAQDAGLQAGDTLLQLDDQPVYALGDLMRIGAAGGESDLIPLTVVRQGEVLQVSVPRGPLGINASVESVDPAAIPAG